MKIGEKAPTFELPGVDGKTHAIGCTIKWK
jgi:hypothetical protein